MTLSEKVNNRASLSGSLPYEHTGTFHLDLERRWLLGAAGKYPLNGVAVVVSPHQDDESLGMGGTISRLVDNGFQVYVIYCSIERLDLSRNLNPERRKLESIEALF